jgi:hypothetical protein
MKTPATTGDWQPELAVLQHAEFHEDQVTIRNVRNFRYKGSEKDSDIEAAYYDKTYDLRQLKKVWYITEPFKGLSIAAHTFLSFEFTNGDFLSMTIEARLVKGQHYDLFMGLLHTYPILYIAADERDAVFLRANIRKSDEYVYPVRLSKPENARLLLVDMLERMNDLAIHPRWYNTLWANCTSMIAYHVNRISPHRLPSVSWQEWLTGYADALALKKGLLDTDLPLDQARKKYYVTKRSQEIGNVEKYSTLIRQFDVLPD